MRNLHSNVILLMAFALAFALAVYLAFYSLYLDITTPHPAKVCQQGYVMLEGRNFAKTNGLTYVCVKGYYFE